MGEETLGHKQPFVSICQNKKIPKIDTNYTNRDSNSIKRVRNKLPFGCSQSSVIILLSQKEDWCKDIRVSVVLLS